MVKKKIFNIYVGMSTILQELTQGPASPTVSRCPQMASKEDARNMTFNGSAEHGLKYHCVSKDWPCDFNQVIAMLPLPMTQPWNRLS